MPALWRAEFTNDIFDEWRRIEVTFDPSLTRQR